METNFTWIVVAVIACISTALTVLLMKHVGNCITKSSCIEDKIHILVLFMVGYIAVAGILCVGLMCFLKTQHNIQGGVLAKRLFEDRRLCGLLIAVAFTIVISQAAIIVSVNLAPNPGYAHVIINMNAMLVFILSVILFGSMMNWLSALGIVLAITGVLMVVSGSMK